MSDKVIVPIEMMLELHEMIDKIRRVGEKLDELEPVSGASATQIKMATLAQGFEFAELGCANLAKYMVIDGVRGEKADVPDPRQTDLEDWIKGVPV